MARPKSLKLKGEEGFFHIMSSTVGQEFYLGDVEKKKLFDIINLVQQCLPFPFLSPSSSLFR